MTPIEATFLPSTIKLFRYYKKLGEGALNQLAENDWNVKPNSASNTIAQIVNHLTGNMVSRWTDFLATDGEKPWRNRESEFEGAYHSKEALMATWEKGWACLLNTLESLTEADLSKIIYIRNEGMPVWEAIQRQLAHYPHHVGQILYQAKALKGDEFKSLSIPKGQSAVFNAEKFNQEKQQKHFTDGL